MVFTQDVPVSIDVTDDEVIQRLEERGYTVFRSEGNELSQCHIDALRDWSDSLARCGFVAMPTMVREALYRITGRILP
jgi:hypothetical protein